MAMSLAAPGGGDFSTHQHNKTTLRNLREGDLIEFKRGLYSHWGVYVGNGEVIHRSGDESDFTGSSWAVSSSSAGQIINKARVCKERFWDIVGNGKAYIQNDKDSSWKHFSPREIVRRAYSQLGEVGYNIFNKNCEHFAKWCRYDREKSDQADGAKTGLGIGALLVGGLLAGGAIAYAIHKSGQEEEEEDEEEPY